MLKRGIYRAIFGLALAGVSLQASTLVVGEPPKVGTGNCVPFGCPEFFGLGTYQQVYLNSAFPGTISIGALEFFEGEVLNNGGLPAAGNFIFSLSYTSFAPGHLSLVNPILNEQSGTQVIFDGSLPTLTRDGTVNQLIFNSAPYLYNPADGNLLLTVAVTGASDSNPRLYLDQSACGPKTFCPPGSSVVSTMAYFGMLNGVPLNGGNDAGGLVTGFSYSSPVSTPEPGSLFLALAGIGAIVFLKRRRSGIARP